MPFNTRSNRTLHVSSLFDTPRGEHSLGHFGSASAYAINSQARRPVYSLRYTGTSDISLSADPQPLDVVLIRLIVARVLAGPCLTEMLQPFGMPTGTELSH